MSVFTRRRPAMLRIFCSVAFSQAASAISHKQERLDASNYIHASATLSDARDWATKEKLLTIDVPAILRIDLAAAGIGLLRDPFSSTGYILDTFHVEKQFIRPVAWERGGDGRKQCRLDGRERDVRGTLSLGELKNGT